MGCMPDFIRQIRAMEIHEEREIKLCYPGGHLMFQMTRIQCQHDQGPILLGPDFCFELRKLDVSQNLWKIGLMGRRRDGAYYKTPSKSLWFMATRIG